MVLDPFSALGLAGNVVQFIEFSCNIISESRQVYRSATGASPENIELESIAEDLSQLSIQLQSPEGVGVVSHISGDAFGKVLLSCKEVADELLHAVQQLKVKGGPHQRWRSFRHALMSVLQKERVSGLQIRLGSLREQITLHLVSTVSDRQSSILRNIENLYQETRRMNVDRGPKLKKIGSALESIQLSYSSLPTKDNLNRLCHILQDSFSATVAISREVEILQSLCYKSMTARHSKIVEAHSKTFDWIFNADILPPNDVRSRIGFRKWLQSDGGIFWVSGKAGSGKSTLMKYVCDHPRTAESLHEWAAGSTLVTASFYFWNAGTDMQKSQQGLLQSLLYTILSKCPDLISTVCSSRWDAKEASSRFQSSELWRPAEILRAFERLQSWASTSRKFCFFIDGLDEYDGDHFDLIDSMVNIVKSPHIKLCLSSRPWNCFEDAFGEDIHRKLYLQDLTREDIEIYVRTKLTRPVPWALTQKDGVRYQELTLEIVELAQGVFLWVFLVVRSLQEGLANGDSISMLQNRLRALPSDLERFFEHILRSVDNIYQEKLAGMFQVALLATQPLSLTTYSFLDEEDLDFAIKLAPSSMNTAEIQSRQEDMRRRINGRSKGLLEVSTAQGSDIFSMYNVEFLHRTVRDFLNTKEMQSMLSGMTSSTYNACFALSRAFLACFKTMPYSTDFNFRPEFLDDTLQFVRRAEDQRNVADNLMLDELERTSKVRFGFFLKSSSSFLEYAIEKGLLLYVKGKLSQHPQLLLSNGGNLLAAALGKPLICGEYEIDLTQMVQMLLKQGLSPNQPLLHSTVLRDFLQSYPSIIADSKEYAYWRNILRLLLLSGANVQVAFEMINDMIDSIAVCERFEFLSTELVCTAELLLSHGLDPNRSSPGGRTIWTRLLERVFDETFFDERIFDKRKYSRVEILNGVLKAFLRYGADPLTVYSHHSKYSTDIRSVYDGLTKHFISCKVAMHEDMELGLLIESETAYFKNWERCSSKISPHDLSNKSSRRLQPFELAPGFGGYTQSRARLPGRGRMEERNQHQSTDPHRVIKRKWDRGSRFGLSRSLQEGR